MAKLETLLGYCILSAGVLVTLAGTLVYIHKILVFFKGF